MEKADSSAEALGLEFAKAKEYVKYVAATMESEEFKNFCSSIYNDPGMLNLRISDLPRDRIVKFYISCGKKENESRKVVKEALEWRIKYNYSNLLNEDYTSHEKEKKLTFLCESKYGFPVLVWRSRRHNAKKHNSANSVRYIVYKVEKAIAEGVIPHRVVLLIDRSGATSKNVESVSFFHSLCYILQLNFPEALEKLVLFPNGWIFTALWKVVKPLLDRSVVKRIALLSEESFRPYLRLIIPEEQLPSSYGGSAPEDSCEEITSEQGESSQNTALEGQVPESSEGDAMGAKRQGENDTKLL